MHCNFCQTLKLVAPTQLITVAVKSCYNLPILLSFSVILVFFCTKYFPMDAIYNGHFINTLYMYKGCTMSIALCYSIFSFMCMYCRSLFVLLCFFFWSLCCLVFLNLRILITRLVSSNSSWNCHKFRFMMFNATFNNISVISWRYCHKEKSI